MIEFPYIHNDDLIPVGMHNGILVSEINHEQQEQRIREFNRVLIASNKKEETNE